MTEATEHACTIFCLALNREKRQKWGRKSHWSFKAPGSHFGRMGRDLKWYEEMQPKEYFLFVCTSVVRSSNQWDFLDSPMVKTPCFQCRAAAAKSLQSYPTLCDPIDSCPPGIWVQSLVEELRSHMPYGAAKKKQPFVIKYQTSNIWRTSSLPRLCKLGTGCSRSMCIAACHRAERWVATSILRAEIDQYWLIFMVQAFPWKFQALYSLQSSKQAALDRVDSAIFVRWGDTFLRLPIPLSSQKLPLCLLFVSNF